MESAPQENSPQASVAEPQPQQPPPAQPICQQETVVRAACKGLNSFIKCKDITARLQQTCAQCGQWVASHRTMKRHYQYTHPEVIQQLGSKAASLIQRTATACPTCHFCHVKCKDWREHIHKCTVIWQCAILCLQQDGRGGHGRVLRPLHTGNPGTLHLLQQPNKRRRPPAGSFRQEPQQPDLLLTLARQVVKQEEEIKLLKQDHSLVLFFRPGEHTMLGFLYKTAKEFKAKQEANPQWTPGQQPLKAVMALALFTELGNRLQSVCQDQAKATRAKELGWRDPTVGWKYQRWNVQLKALEEDTSRPPFTDKEVAVHIRKLVPLHEEAAGDQRLPATFQMDLSVRTPAALEAWGALLALQGSTGLQLGGFAYKRESLKPSPAVAKLKGYAARTLRLILVNRGNACYMNTVCAGDSMVARGEPELPGAIGARNTILSCSTLSRPPTP